MAVALAAPVAGFAADENARNACGCYKGGSGNCYCDKGAKCGCPGECEPKGCEEKRERELEREIQSETKRAEDAARKQGGEGGPVEPPAPKRPVKPKPAPKLTPKQSHELSHLLQIYVAGHPETAGKTVQDLLQDLGGGQ
jgi:hypothetical protein